MPTILTVSGDDITLDKLLWRKHGARGRDLFEKALAINPGIGALGLILPLGTVVTLPDLPAETMPAVKVVTIFG